jgi:flagellar hook-associated protein 3
VKRKAGYEIRKMSGTLNNIYNNVSFALYLHTKALAKLQEQASTGSRINRISDDPSAAYRVLGFSTNEKSLVNYIDNLSDVVSTLELSYTVVKDIVSILGETKKRLTQITSGIYDEEARKRTAEEIDDILEHVVLLANTKQMDQYLFGGTDTASAPYIVQRSNGKITSVTYQGSFQDRDIEVAPGVQSSAFYIGDNIFRSDSRGTPVFLGNTGAAAGSGTSNVQGYTWLTITDDTDPAKYRLSINDGTDYVTVDKGKGPETQTLTFSAVPTSGSFTLTFDGQKTGAIQWNEGAAEVETALEALPNLSADDVTVTGSYAVGFTITFADTLGNVPELVAGDNTLDNGGAITITEGTTTEGIGDTNLAVTDSAGRVLYVNTTEITSTGVDLISIPGTHDVFNMLITLRDILNNERGFSEIQLDELRNDVLISLDEVSKLLVQTEVSAGSKIGFLDNLKDSLNNLKYNAEDESTRLQEADIAQIAIDLSRQEVLYQMSLSVAARIMSMSLLDFLG